MHERRGPGRRRTTAAAFAAGAALVSAASCAFAQERAHGVDPSHHVGQPHHVGEPLQVGDWRHVEQAQHVEHTQHDEAAQQVEHPRHADRPQRVENVHGSDHADHATAGHDAEPVVPPITAAQRAAAFPDLGDVRHGHGLEDPFNTFVLIDRLEAAELDASERLDWEVRAWAGRSLRRIWLRSEGERVSGDPSHADVELLAGIAIARWWELVAGARHDFEPGPGRTWAAFGAQGVAPYGFELEATAYLGDGGRAAARVDAGHELAITPRLILEPEIELDWYGSADRERGLGRGLARVELALRLRYEIRREIAPYVGVVREKAFGDTADLRRAAGRDPDDTRLVAGVRLWF